jgi:alpha-D-ribose 1-methylphosphonate 5-triphosphate diphosphatase
LATANPALALGLTDRGRIATGLRADLAIVDRSDRVRTTLRAGAVIYTNGEGRDPVQKTSIAA